MTTRITHSRKHLIGLLATALGLLALVSPVGQAHSAVSNGGTYEEGYARCYNGYIQADPPRMYAGTLYAPAGTFIYGGNTQTVKFRSNLAQFIPGVGWRTVQNGVWKMTVANDQEYGAYRWTTLSGAPIDASHRFYGLKTGTAAAPVYYHVWTEYVWVGDQFHYGASTWDANPHHEDRASAWDQSTYWGCKYPGPNAITMIG
jgi:hypothetical protein